MKRTKRSCNQKTDYLEILLNIQDLDQSGKCYLKFIDTYIGYGVFAAHKIEKGELILEYKGQLTRTDNDDDPMENGFRFFFRHREETLCIDATNTVGLGRMVNDAHGNKANCKMRKMIVEGAPRLCLLTIKEISSGEELRYDYGVPDLPWRKLKKGDVKQVLYDPPINLKEYGLSETTTTVDNSVSVNGDDAKDIENLPVHNAISMECVLSESTTTVDNSVYVSIDDAKDIENLPVHNAISMECVLSESTTTVDNSVYVSIDDAKDIENLPVRNATSMECVLSETTTTVDNSVSVNGDDAKDIENLPVHNAISMECVLSETTTTVDNSVYVSIDDAKDIENLPVHNATSIECVLSETTTTVDNSVNVNGDDAKDIENLPVHNATSIECVLSETTTTVDNSVSVNGDDAKDIENLPVHNAISMECVLSESTTTVDNSVYVSIDDAKDIENLPVHNAISMECVLSETTTTVDNFVSVNGDDAKDIENLPVHNAISMECVLSESTTTVDNSVYVSIDDAKDIENLPVHNAISMECVLSESTTTVDNSVYVSIDDAKDIENLPVHNATSMECVLSETTTTVDNSVRVNGDDAKHIENLPVHNATSIECVLSETTTTVDNSVSVNGDDAKHIENLPVHNATSIECVLSETTTTVDNSVSVNGDDAKHIENLPVHNATSMECVLSEATTTVDNSLLQHHVNKQLRHPNPISYQSKTSAFSSSDSESDLFVESDGDSDYVANSESSYSESSDVSDVFPVLSKSSILNENIVTSTSGISDLLELGTRDSLTGKIRSPEETMSTDSGCTSSTLSKVCDTCSISVMATNNRESRVYDKKHYCVYCEKPQSKLPRHLLTRHAEETEVALYTGTKDVDVKANLLCKLRNLGNHQHNTRVIKEKSGELIVAYRQEFIVSWENYVPCEFCLGYYVHWELWKHVARCLLRPSNKSKSRRVVVNSRLLLPVPRDVSDGLSRLLVTFCSDDVSRLVKSDPLILQFGEKLFLKLGHDRENFSTIRNQMRELGRLLRHLREFVGLSDANLAVFIDPLYFTKVVTSAKHVAGFCEETHLFKTPSLALKLGHSLKKCAKILKGNALQSGDEVLLNKSTSFWELCDMNWCEEISTHALRSLGENTRNRVKLIPLTKDCEALHRHLKNIGQTAYQALEATKSNTEAWCDLSSTSLTQVILFNRRRQGEVSKMKLADFEGKHTASGTDVLQTLSPLEQHLCKVLSRIEIVGKRGRIVPLILTSEMKKWITLLIESRETVGINADNKFVFARAHYGSLGHIRGSDCLRSHSEDCGAQFPKLLRSNKLRKQIATLSQLLNLKENELDILANFLGHDIRVHREFYRLPEDTLQIAKVSKLLLSLESGQFTDHKGKSLDEITVDVAEEIGVEVDEEEVSGEDSDAEFQLSPLTRDDDISGEMQASSTPSSSKGTKWKFSRRVWSEGEKAAVMRHFQKHIYLDKLPGKKEISKCLERETVLKRRSWRNIKDFVRNKIQTRKSKYKV